MTEILKMFTYFLLVLCMALGATCVLSMIYILIQERFSANVVDK